MYSIATIIYGIPLNSNKRPYTKHSEKLEDAIDNEHPGFITMYSGGGDCTPMAFGVATCEFDVCCHHVDLSTLKLTPNDCEMLGFSKLWNDLPVDLKEEMTTKFGQPRMFLLWSTS